MGLGCDTKKIEKILLDLYHGRLLPQYEEDRSVIRKFLEDNLSTDSHKFLSPYSTR